MEGAGDRGGEEGSNRGRGKDRVGDGGRGPGVVDYEEVGGGGAARGGDRVAGEGGRGGQTE